MDLFNSSTNTGNVYAFITNPKSCKTFPDTGNQVPLCGVGLVPLTSLCADVVEVTPEGYETIVNHLENAVQLCNQKYGKDLATIVRAPDAKWVVVAYDPLSILNGISETRLSSELNTYCGAVMTFLPENHRKVVSRGAGAYYTDESIIDQVDLDTILAKCCRDSEHREEIRRNNLNELRKVMASIIQHNYHICTKIVERFTPDDLDGAIMLAAEPDDKVRTIGVYKLITADCVKYPSSVVCADYTRCDCDLTKNHTQEEMAEQAFIDYGVCCLHTSYFVTQVNAGKAILFFPKEAPQVVVVDDQNDDDTSFN